MVLFAVFFSAGVAALHQLRQLPGGTWILAASAAVLALIALQRWQAARRYPGTTLAAVGLICGFAWSHGFALLTAPASLLLPTGRLEVQIVGSVRDLPQQRDGINRFVLETRHALPGSDPPAHPHRLRLSWRGAPPLAPGDVWRLTARLKAARGYASPGAWDYERWLYRQGIRYTGYVVDHTDSRRLDDMTCCAIDRWRQRVSDRLDALPLSAFSRGVLRALVVADRSGLDRDHNALFRATGTSHLMAVSGLHIGLVSGGVMLLIGWVWRRVPRLCNKTPARIAAATAGLVAAVAYAAMAGFGLPTQRALVMLLVFAGAIVLRRRSASANALALAAVAVLAWHPPSILDTGFWLSFAAVATILATLQWTRGRPAWVAAITVQLALTLALWPVLLGAGLPASAVSPLVNLVLVPLFGVLIVPWSLIGGLTTLLVPDGAAALLWPLGQLLDLVATGLAAAAHWSPHLPGLGPAALWLLVPAVCLLLLPPGIPLRWAGVPLLALPWLPRAPLVEPGEFQFHLLDVGQGLSAVVETHRHVLVFDTGPIYPSGFSTAEAVVLPFLARRGHAQVDHLMISHGDNDHGGGLDVMRARIGIDRVSGGEPGRIGWVDHACAAGQRWHWDGVDFTVLHPAPASPRSGNNASCVLRVENAAGALLLTGDVEAAVERRLVKHQSDRLGARVVVAPHHGSRSSSTAEFIAATSPDRVLFAAGWANRYGFPDPDVVARWIDGGALPHETAQDGTLSFRFASDGRLHGPTRYRVSAQRFWSAAPETAIPGTADRGLAVSSRHQAGPARRSRGG